MRLLQYEFGWGMVGEEGSAHLAKGGLDVIVHHGNVCLEDAQRSARQAGCLIDGHSTQICIPVPVVLQNEHQLLIPIKNRLCAGSTNQK